MGSANYDNFFKTVVWTFCFVSLHMSSLVVHLALYFLENTKVRSLASSWFGGADAGIILVGFNIGFLVLTAFCSFMVMQLLVFHLGLKRERITTYQYIIRDSAKKRERVLLSNKIRQRRVIELEKAGNSVEAFCLKVGALGCCKSCDPVRRLVLQEMDQVDTNQENGNDDRSYSHYRGQDGDVDSGDENGNHDDHDDDEDDHGDEDEIGNQVIRGGGALSTLNGKGYANGNRNGNR